MNKIWIRFMKVVNLMIHVINVEKRIFLNWIELKQMKFNILEIYVMYQEFLVQVTLQSMHRKHMKKLDIHVTNVKFSVISVPSYYSLELLAYKT